MDDQIFFFLPAFKNNDGHENSFVDVLKKFSKKNSLRHYFLTPKKNKLQNYNYNIFYKSNFFLDKILNVYKNYFQLLKILQKHYQKKTIIYLDGYSLYDLLSICLNSNKFKFKLILFKRHTYNNFFSNLIFNFLLKFLKFNQIKIVFLTDTLILKNKIKKLYKIKTLLMPVPHIFTSKYFIKKNFDEKKIKIWCPGPIRKEKYGQNLENFIRFNINNNFELHLNKNYQTSQILKLISIKKIKSNLTRNEYYKKFLKTHLIILPYDSKNYLEKTSGIFIESISLCKITLVSSNTWMANEFIKHGLKCLVIKNWSNFDIYFFLEKNNLNEIYKRVLIMRKKYIKFHNKNNFINKLEYAIK